MDTMQINGKPYEHQPSPSSSSGWKYQAAECYREIHGSPRISGVRTKRKRASTNEWTIKKTLQLQQLN